MARYGQPSHLARVPCRQPPPDQRRPAPIRAFGIADQFSVHLDEAGQVHLQLSAGMTGYLRDAAYHLADDPTDADTWDEEARDLLVELGHALSDALDLLRAREG